MPNGVQANPYASPVDGKPQELHSDEPSLRRPFGVPFVAGLLGISATGAMVKYGWLIRHLPVDDDQLWVPLEYRTAITWGLAVAVVRLAAAIGLASGRSWGWYSAAFSLALSSLQYGWAVWHTSVLAGSTQSSSLGELRGQNIVRVGMAFAAFIYLQRSHVLRYYRIPQHHLPWLLTIIGAAAFASLMGLRFGSH